MRRIRTVSSLLAFFGSSVVSTAWLLSRLASDRWLWSQYPWWTPTWIYGAAALALLGIAWLVAPRARRARRISPQRVATVGVACLVAWWALVECRVYRWPARESLAQAAERPGGLRVLFWNSAALLQADYETWLNAVPSDLAIVANPTWGKSFSPAAERYGRPWFIPAQRFVIFSRYPVLRYGYTDLGLHGRQQVPMGNGVLEAPRGGVDPGHALWMELDTNAALGRPIVVWVIDLPSDQNLSRRLAAEQAARAMQAWEGPALVPDGRGGIQGNEPASGFPTPDLVIGDFNSPRGSYSLTLLGPDLTNAYDQAGAGYVATYPRQFPLLHIDQAFTGPTLRATDYRIIDPGRGRHLMQWVRVEPR